MTEKYTIKDVTQDLGFLLSLTNLLATDEDGFWIDTGTEERFKYSLDSNGEGREIVIFQDPMPKGDYLYFNPFAEGFGKKSPASTLFYKTVRVAFNVNIRMVILRVVEELLLSKEDKDHKLSPPILRMSSVPVEKKTTIFDLVDEKMINEFTTVLDRLESTDTNGCVYVVYLPNQMTAKVRCDALTDPKFDEKFGKDVRKKSLSAFKALIMGILGIKDPSELETFTEKYDPSLKSSARLHTTMTVFLNLYSRFNDAIPEGNEIDLGGLSEVIDRFPLAYAIAKHMIQPSMPTKSPTDISTSDTTKFSAPQSSGKRFLTPEVVDNFGRPIRQMQAPTPQTGGTGRFKPQIIEARSDPFAPASSSMYQPQTNSVWNQPTQSGYTPGGYFDGPNAMAPFNTGLNINPPSNFGSPGTRRGYFG